MLKKALVFLYHVKLTYFHSVIDNIVVWIHQYRWSLVEVKLLKVSSSAITNKQNNQLLDQLRNSLHITETFEKPAKYHNKQNFHEMIFTQNKTKDIEVPGFFFPLKICTHIWALAKYGMLCMNNIEHFFSDNKM